MRLKGSLAAQYFLSSALASQLRILLTQSLVCGSADTLKLS